jgi:hypothetical protein
MSKPPKYWALARRDDPGEPPFLYDRNGVPPWITEDPRQLRVHDVTDDDPVDLLTRRDWLLLTLKPNGTITPAAAGTVECRAGWTVAARSGDLGPLAGPQHAAVRALITTAERIFGCSDDADFETADRYAAAVKSMYGTPETKLAWEVSIVAAAAALEQAGADTDWWRTAVDHREYDAALIALTARDLARRAGTGWCWDAYRLLTTPWLAATGQPAHPGDTKRWPDQGQPASVPGACPGTGTLAKALLAHLAGDHLTVKPLSGTARPAAPGTVTAVFRACCAVVAVRGGPDQSEGRDAGQEGSR